MHSCRFIQTDDNLETDFFGVRGKPHRNLEIGPKMGLRDVNLRTLKWVFTTKFEISFE